MHTDLMEPRTGRAVPVDASSSWLFVPGDRPERFAKAHAAGAHQVILDLEDAVSVATKPAAREAVAQWVGDGRDAWVRVNAPGSSAYADDVVAIKGSGALGVMVPKATVDGVRTARQDLGADVPLIALVESAVGLQEADRIARCDGVVTLAFGSIDFAVDIDAEETWEAMLFARSALVLAARAAGLTGPIDGVSTAVKDPEQAGRDAAAARALGFGGKLCIHPSQVVPVNVGFAPSAEQLDWALQIAHAIGGVERLEEDDLSTALQVDGQMVDRPVVLRARRILQRHAINDL